MGAKRCPAPAIYVGPSPGMGRGVFAARPIRKGEVIERCPVIPLTKADQRKVTGTTLERYTYGWGVRQRLSCVALGCGSLYNHSPHPNAAFDQVTGEDVIEFTAVRDIAKGEQVFIDYRWDEAEYAAWGGA